MFTRASERAHPHPHPHTHTNITYRKNLHLCFKKHFVNIDKPCRIICSNGKMKTFKVVLDKVVVTYENMKTFKVVLDKVVVTYENMKTFKVVLDKVVVSLRTKKYHKFKHFFCKTLISPPNIWMICSSIFISCNRIHIYNRTYIVIFLSLFWWHASLFSDQSHPIYNFQTPTFECLQLMLKRNNYTWIHYELLVQLFTCLQFIQPPFKLYDYILHIQKPLPLHNHRTSSFDFSI